MKSEKTHIGDTIRVLRPPPRVYTDTVGQTVWMGDVEHVELELEDRPENTDPYNCTAVPDMLRR